MFAGRETENRAKKLSTPMVPFHRQPPPGARFASAGIIAAFLVLSLAFQVVILNVPRPHMLVSGDPANVSSFIAGWLYPDRFTMDPILSDRQQYTFYITILIPLVIAANAVVHDIGTAYALMQFPIVFIQLVGFWRLGLFLFGRNPPSLALALLTLPPVNVMAGGGEMWGTFDEPLTRMTYNTLLPFLLLAFLRYGAGRVAPLWLFALCGLSVYFHPVSAPTIALALWLGCLALRWPLRPISFQLAVMIVAGLIFLLVALPFALVFFPHFPGLGSGSTTSAIQEVLQSSDWTPYTDVIKGVKSIIFDLAVRGWGWRWCAWVIGLEGYLIVLLLRPDQRRLSAFFLLCILGIVAGSVGVSWVDQRIAAAFGRLPVQLDLIRNIRFLVPILLIGLVWLFVALEQTISCYTARSWNIMVMLLTVLVAIWWMKHETSVSRVAVRLARGYSVRPSPTELDQAKVLQYLKDSDEGSTVLVLGQNVSNVSMLTSLGLAVRYGALQPVSYLPKDGNSLFYSGSFHFTDWLTHEAQRKRLHEARTDSDAAASLTTLVCLAHPRYLLIDWVEWPVVMRKASLRFGQMVLDTASLKLVELRSADFLACHG